MDAVQEKLSLANLGGGGANELFEVEFRRILENIQDLNTDAEAPRQITIKVTVRADETRKILSVGYNVAAKTVGYKTHKTLAYVGRENGRLVAVAHNPQQPELGFEDKPLKAVEGANND